MGFRVQGLQGLGFLFRFFSFLVTSLRGGLGCGLDCSAKDPNPQPPPPKENEKLGFRV